MSFADPEWLWLLLLALVPLVLYLLPLPRRRIATSALYLWERFLGAERFGRTSERFRRAMGFALLVAILASLVLAAADLMVGAAARSAGRVVVLIDNSARLGATVQGQANFLRAKAAIRDRVRSLPASAELTVAEAAGDLGVVYPTGPGGARAAEAVETLRPFEGPVDLAVALERAWQLWGAKEAEIYIFSDRALPPSSWGKAARLWLAPAAGDNVGVTALQAARHGVQVALGFTVSNFGAARSVSGSVLCNRQVRKRFDLALAAGQAAAQAVELDEPAEALVEVRLEATGDPLAADDAAFLRVPSAEAMTVGLAWPEGRKRNDYVLAVLGALQKEGALSGFSESAAGPATVYVNHAPPAWKEGGAIVLYPLRSGLVEIPGLVPHEVTVTRQAQDDLLKDVDLTGLSVSGAVRSTVPPWARPLVWADDVPLIWAGETVYENHVAPPPSAEHEVRPTDTAHTTSPPRAAVPHGTKVLFVGIPVMPVGTRLPLVASFPALMRNALAWMTPGPESRRPGQMVDGWTSRTCGFVKDPAGGLIPFSVTSAETSDLRRTEDVQGEPIGRPYAAATVLVAIAALLLLVEWGLFHRRLTE